MSPVFEPAHAPHRLEVQPASQLPGQGLRVAVVGGGASGLASALAAAQAGARVTIIEKNARVGRSILASGNGRCNFTNANLSARHFNCPDFVQHILGVHALQDVLDFFDAVGLWYLPGDQGRYYPASRCASSVLDVLLNACAAAGVHIRTSCRVTGLTPPRPKAGQTGWLVQMLQAATGKVSDAAADSAGLSTSRHVKGGREDRTGKDGHPRHKNRHGAPGAAGAARDYCEPFDAVIWCGGGGSAQGILDQEPTSLIHTPVCPVLCPVATETEPVAGLDGVRSPARVRLYAQPDSSSAIFDDRGEVLFRPYGISGIVVFDLSRTAQPGMCVELDLLPGFDEGRLTADACRRASSSSLENIFDGIVHPALGLKAVRLARQQKDGAPADVARRAACILKHFRLRITGMADSSHAQVMRGGIALSQIDPCSFQVLDPRLSGLYLAGEALDVDGACGGFNLSWAFLSGLAAGKAAAGAQSSPAGAPCMPRHPQ